mmetsp:Transcript_13201/g.18689  ORF Transcript_13201/g.18689 Transcript_13201/m.18689 type:complete len:248 (-) Transcript_13201:1757-2500(-)
MVMMTMVLPCLHRAQVVQVVAVLYQHQATQVVHHLPTAPRLLRMTLGGVDVREGGVHVVVAGGDVQVLHRQVAGHPSAVGRTRDPGQCLSHHQDVVIRTSLDRILATVKVAMVRIAALEIRRVGDREIVRYLRGLILVTIRMTIFNLHPHLGRVRTKRRVEKLPRKTTNFVRIGMLRNHLNQILVMSKMLTMGLLDLLDRVLLVIRRNPPLKAVIAGAVQSHLGRTHAVVEIRIVVDDLYPVRIGGK